MATVNTFTDFSAEQKALERRRKMAEMLGQQSMQPIEVQQNAPISWTQQLAKALQGYQAGREERDVGEREKALSGKRNQALAEAMGAMPREQTSDMNLVKMDDEGNAMPAANVTTQPTMHDYSGWMSKLSAVGPDAVAMGTGLMGMQQKSDESKENRLFRAQQATEQREQAMQQLQLRLQDQRLTAQDRAAMQQQLAQMQIDARREMQQFAVNNRQPVAPQIVQTETGPMQVDRRGRGTPIVGPDGKPVAPKSTERALPTSAAQKLMENQQNLRRAEQALGLLTPPKEGELPMDGNDPNATGWKGYVPDFALQRLDPKGVQARAAISDIGSLVIHDRSGAAVTASEFPRLQPFIPRAEDDPATARKKLDRFVKEYRAVVDEAADFYRNSGYKVPVETLRGSGASGSGMPSQSEIDAEMKRRGL